MSTRIAAWRDGEKAPEDIVFVVGHSLAHAVRRAVHALGVGGGQTRVKTETAPGEWRWDWSGTVLQVRVIPHGDPFVELCKPWPPMHISPSVPDARVTGALAARLWKQPAIIDLRFGQRVTMQLSHEACAELARGGSERGGRDAYVEALLLEAASARSRTGTAE